MSFQKFVAVRGRRKRGEVQRREPRRSPSCESPRAVDDGRGRRRGRGLTGGRRGGWWVGRGDRRVDKGNRKPVIVERAQEEFGRISIGLYCILIYDTVLYPHRLLFCVQPATRNLIDPMHSSGPIYPFQRRPTADIPFNLRPPRAPRRLHPPYMRLAGGQLTDGSPIQPIQPNQPPRWINE